MNRRYTATRCVKLLIKSVFLTVMLKLCEENEIKKKNNVKMNN
jgi:hypothetical protein